MKTGLLFSLALVLYALFAVNNTTRGSDIDASRPTDSAQNYLKVRLNTPWTGTKVYLYRTRGGPVELDGKRATATVQEFLYSYDAEVLAFVDPDKGNAWAGSVLVDVQPPSFYLETDSGIFRGMVRFGTMKGGTIRPDDHDVRNGAMAYGQVEWHASLVPTVKRGEKAEAVIDELTKDHDLESVVTKVRRDEVSIIQNSLSRVENGLDPWLFVDEQRGSRSAAPTTVTGIEASNGELQLDLKNPAGNHTATVWIDLKTWNVVKAIQDGKP
ncbi:MAG: hypothetical protein ABSG14_00285 [Verrucomicrobiia bacterium]|jgi:hypothetical protein